MYICAINSVMSTMYMINQQYIYNYFRNYKRLKTLGSGIRLSVIKREREREREREGRERAGG